MKTVTVNGMSVEYEDFPASRADAPCIVLLHEGLGSVSMWRDFPRHVAERTGARVVVWSRAGYGNSDPWPEARTPRYMHREALEAMPAQLTALGIEHPVLLGHSDGGSIALIFAGAFPDAVRGIIVMAPHEFVEEQTLAGIRRARDAWQTTDWPAKLARYHSHASRVFAEWAGCWLSPPFRDWNIEDSLPGIRCPVLAIQGEDDEYATMRQIDVIAEQVPGTQLLKLAQCGHTPQRDQPLAVLDAVSAFVARLSGD